MDDELRTLHEAMVLKERLRTLAELQASYWRALLEQGFEQGTAEQLVLDWSRHAYDMTMRCLPATTPLDTELDRILAEEEASRAPFAAAPDAPRGAVDPSCVPPGEPWLQLAPELDEIEHPGEQAA